ncbi:MAG: dimethylargininase [Jatrophihabitantaceae bacterium]
MPNDSSPVARRQYLMCPPEYYDVQYSINPWMDPRKPVDTGLAMAQWERLRETHLGLGHQVELIDPVPGLPDMVFAANGASVIGNRALIARYRYPQRAAEAPAYRDWLLAHGFEVTDDPRFINEGQGDYLVDGERLLAGTGFRTERLSHDEAQELYGLPVVSLTLVNPSFYHLDTALAILSEGGIMYYPEAFSIGSQQVLRRLYPDAILANRRDAEAFGLNAVSDGVNVVLPQIATHLIEVLRERGYHPIGVDMSELHKSGGAVKCCTLELVSETAAAAAAA